MRELRVDGLAEDRRSLIVTDRSTAEQFRVPLDDDTVEALVSAVGPAGSDVSTDPTGQEERMEPIALSPREIQTRIRRGESAEQLAEITGMDLARVEVFAGPVVAEREYLAQQARRTTVRRRHAGGSGVQLGTLVDDGLRALGGVPDDAGWDAFRREDGRWTVVVTSSVLDAVATFLYDVESRYVLPSDGAAHDLVGDVALPESPDMALADAIRDAPQDVAEPAEPAEPEQDVAEEHVELELDLDLPPDVAAAEALLDAQTLSPVSSLKEARDRRAQTTMDQRDDEPTDVEHDVLDHTLEVEHDIAVPDHQGSPQHKKRHERRRVPSWDEIMFGDKQD